MTDHQHNHIHEDGIEYHDPRDLGFNPLQLGCLSHITNVIFGVYNIGIDPDDHTNGKIVDLNTERAVPFTLNEDGSVNAFGEDGMPGVVFAFSCVAHPGLSNGEASEPFHSLMGKVFDVFAEHEGMGIESLIITGRLLAKECGLIPADVPAVDHH